MSPRLHPFARLCIAAFGLLASQFAAGLGLAAIYIGVLMARTPGQSLDKVIGQVARVSETNTLLITLFVYPIGVLWLGFCRAKLDKRSFISLGLRRSRAGSNLGRGLVAGFLSIAVIWAILWVTGAIAVNGWSAAARGPNVVLAIAGWLLAFAAVGFFEEFLFRGYTLHNLTNWLGWRAAVIIQATIFALVHLGNVVTASNEARVAALGAMPSIFLIGVFFAISYRKTGSLWFPIGFHAAWNFSLGCLFSLPVSGIKTFQLLDVQTQTQSWLSGGSFGAEGSFFLLPVLVALIWFMLQAPDHPQALLDLELTKPEPQPALSIAPPIAATANGTIETETEPERENRYQTKFGTSEGFDSDMLRELRELQHQREANEAAARQENAVSSAIIETELLKPIAVVEKSTENIEVAQQAKAPEPVIESPEVEVVAELPKIEVAPPEVAAPKIAAPEVAAPEIAAPEVAAPEVAAPVEKAIVVEIVRNSDKARGNANSCSGKESAPEMVDLLERVR